MECQASLLTILPQGISRLAVSGLVSGDSPFLTWTSLRPSSASSAPDRPYSPYANNMASRPSSVRFKRPATQGLGHTKLSTVADLEGLERVCNHLGIYPSLHSRYRLLDCYQARECIEERSLPK